ncbi:MAG: hypothetical protein HYR88_01545 [Verrucomicrobia bacterium]|nr:hypothetical protein [Verrucomicrobiota bacterium]MBI3868377.1 hypothetical protein [Verrucomicrobiota bacterium]
MTLPRLFLIGVPARVGGAATKIRHLLPLLRAAFHITLVFLERCWFREPDVMGFIKSLGMQAIFITDVPASPGAVALVICEPKIFVSGAIRKLKAKGLRVVFSNEMMFPFEGEAEAAKEGLIDKALFVSDFQRRAFSRIYEGVSQAITGNFIDPGEFPFKPRRNPVFTIGRLSRPDAEKFPHDFPVFYEELGLKSVRYRVMAWDGSLDKAFCWHRFGPEWDLIPARKETAAAFLHSLDLFVYPIGHRVQESWGRSTVESMLTGAVPVVPSGHQFHNLMVHGESGFICETFQDFQGAVMRLHDDYAHRSRMARIAAEHARENLCNPRTHREIWERALLA